MADLLELMNGQPAARSEIPRLPFETFYRSVSRYVKEAGFVVHFFAYPEGGSTILLAVLRKDSSLHIASTEVGEVFASLTGGCSDKFHMFEREIAEQYGIRPDGHPWLKMVRYHPNYMGRKDVFGNDYGEEIPGNYPYYRVEGESVHEVAVGPVHAGIIEPGHFRFQCAGEEVLHLEIQLGYQHRGVEKLLCSVPMKRMALICESIAGDTALGHNLCHCQAIEALAGITVPRGACLVRMIGLELERIANHVGDLGALSGDVAFSPPAAYFGRMRGEFLNLLQVLCGNRFGKGLVRPGGVAYEMGEEQCRLIEEKLDETEPELKNVCDLLFSAHTVLARFENTGTVRREDAEALGLVGYAGRACGLAYDVRECLPSECYGEMDGISNRFTDGDVHSRARVREEEIFHSIGLIRKMIGIYRRENLQSVCDDSGPSEIRLAPDSFVVTLNEGWRGEVSHCILTDRQGRISRYKIKDPSFHNWMGLAMSLRNQGISDFPLCNKSYNLSYCGFDL